GRPAAAGGGGARAGRRARDPARRRAHRQPRLPQRRAGDGADARAAPRRRHHLHGHPRSPLRSPRRSHRAAVRRSRGGGALGVAVMETVLQDVRYAARSLRKAPGFTALAVICIAIGIGLNTTIFSVVNAVLLKPLEFRDPQRLVEIQDHHLKSGPHDLTAVSYLDFLDLKQRATSFSDMAALTGKSLTL